MVIWLIVLGIITNALTLYLPTLISFIINSYIAGEANLTALSIEFALLSAVILLFASIQALVQTYASERVARDLRSQLIDTISCQNYHFIQQNNPAKLLTYLTSDIDSIKQFVSQAIVSLVSSYVIIVGAAGIMLYTDWKLALAVLTIIPVIGVTFFIIFRQVRKLFKLSREVIDDLNRVINESIIGAAIIRVLNAQAVEYVKFTAINARAQSIGIGILQLFSFLVPIISFVSSIGTLIVVLLGGYFVTSGAMTLGAFVAFTSYIAILIFPILVLGFISNIISQAYVSYKRITTVLLAPPSKDTGTKVADLTGVITLENIALTLDDTQILQKISFHIEPKTKTAIIGPTGSGKTQLLNVITGLTLPDEGSIFYDGTLLQEYNQASFYPQIGIVFQDSVLFNTTIRENVAFSTTVTNQGLQKAIETAELQDFIHELPQGLNTIISERGTSLSGGQKQRIMLARALALEPKILFLDDFTARVDTATEQKILSNIQKNYTDLTLVSITQKIAPIEHYDQVIVLIDGQIIAKGIHASLLETSVDYQLINNSQRSTESYELRS
jgi:ATP-binding cassette, subfamily B, bacterial